MTAITISNNKFTTTSTTFAPKVRQYRQDVGCMDSQLESVAFNNRELKKVHTRQIQQEQHRNKEDHCNMLLMLLGEANRFHATNTKRFVCKINKKVVERAARPGLSQATIKALVTDVDIVMNDDDKDNYQHALSAIAALSLWH